VPCHFTLSRDAATSHDDMELMGLDHAVVQDELARWRAVPPEELGIAVSVTWTSRCCFRSGWLRVPLAMASAEWLCNRLP